MMGGVSEGLPVALGAPYLGLFVGVQGWTPRP